MFVHTDRIQESTLGILLHGLPYACSAPRLYLLSAGTVLDLLTPDTRLSASGTLLYSSSSLFLSSSRSLALPSVAS